MAILRVGRGNYTSVERRRGENWRRLTAKVREKPEEQRKGNAENEAGDDGEIESGVFAAVDDVSGELSEAEGELGSEVENGADEHEKAA
jgi:hypothetical protein